MMSACGVGASATEAKAVLWALRDELPAEHVARRDIQLVQHGTIIGTAAEPIGRVGPLTGNGRLSIVVLGRGSTVDSSDPVGGMERATRNKRRRSA